MKSIWFEKPPVYVHQNGSFYIKVEELIHSQKFWDIMDKFLNYK